MKTIRRRMIKKLVGSNYHLKKAHYLYTLHRQRQGYRNPPLLIFQMGKVGSQTVRQSLRASQLDAPIYYTHYLTGPYLVCSEENRKKYFGTRKQHRIQQAWQSRYLRKRIEKDLRSGNRWKVITLIRDPIARNVSMFFQGLEVEPLDSAHSYRIKSDFVDPDDHDFEIEVDVQNIELLISWFLDHQDEETRSSCMRFFDIQLQPIFGIDVFGSGFPQSKGYKIYNGEKADLLLIRLESLDQCAREAFKAFLDIEDIVLLNSNVSDEKGYAPLYERFKETISFSEDVVDQMYTSKYMKHFYTQDEIDGFKAKWCK